MTIPQIITGSRTCRRFKGDPVSSAMLESFADCARLSASARDMQILRYILVSDQSVCRDIFKNLVLGGALAPEQRPTEGQMPRGYVVIAGPERMDNFSVMDIGIAAQSMFLAAGEAGIGCCMVGAFNKNALADLLGMPENLEAKLVLAFGTPAETRKIVGRRPDGKLTYYRNEKDEHCVPKITIEEAVVRRF